MNHLAGDWKSIKVIDIDPYEDGRPPVFNYKLLISGLIPRPIGFVSSLNPDGESNLAPFSYTQMVNHDPPIFVIGFAGSSDSGKDTLLNVLETKELVINTVSEHMIEGMNYTSINAPRGVSEWAMTGFSQHASVKVKPARVAESIFTIECELVDHKEWKNASGKVTGVTIFARGVMFHVREDAINEQRNLIDPAVLRPVSRLGGITYSVIDTGFEMLRPDFEEEMKKDELKGLVGAQSKQSLD